MNSNNKFAEQFEDLRIWQESRVQAMGMYRSFGVESPAARDWGFRDQVQRAGVSVMNNIAEGFERRTPADFSRFLDNAKGSCGEVRSMLYLAEDLNYLSTDQAQQLRARSFDLSRGIEAHARTLRTRKS